MTEAHKRRDTLITLFLQAGNEMIDELVERLGAAGYGDIRAAHSRVFENIDANGTRVTELAARARMTHPSMSELVTGLERLGYVERVSELTDRRARLVRLTPAGRTLQRLALSEIAKIETAWMQRLGPEVGPSLRAALVQVLGSEPAIRQPGVPHPAGGDSVSIGR